VLPTLPAAPHQRRRFFFGLFAVITMLLVLLFAALITGLPGVVMGMAHSKGTATPPRPTPVILNLADFFLNSLSMVSPDEGWAVGNTSPYYNSSNPPLQSGNYVQPIILHYAHGRWTPEPLPDFAHSALCLVLASPGTCSNITLRSISMVSAQEGWAVGSTVPPINLADAGRLALLLHYHAGTWTVENLQAVYLTSLYMRSVNDGWMIGDLISPDGGGPSEVLHYDGHSWAPISDPVVSRVTPYSITGEANGELWVSGVDYSVSVGDGFDGNAPAVLLHYDGTRWSKVDPQIANGRLYGFAFVSPNEGWAVGELPNTNQHKAAEEDGLILSFQHGVWEKQALVKAPPSQPYFSLTSVAMASPNEGWAVGKEGTLMRYSNGAWSMAQSPSGENLSSLTMVSASEGWAIGDHGVILHEQNGSWNLYQGS
jgi:hypothetical protein